MPSCCPRDDYQSMFTPREAARAAASFRRRGLQGSARDLAEMVAAAAPPGAVLLEVGGGIGQIQIALLESGAISRALNVDLSGNWEAAAAGLLTERGLDDRVERVVGDFADEAARLPEAAAVVLHRVVCCYPDWRALLDAAAGRSAGLLALTFPIAIWPTRLAVWSGNLWLRARRNSFRAYVHSPLDMIEHLRRAGFRVAQDRTRMPWRTVLLEKGAAV